MQKDIQKDSVTIDTQARFENVAAALYLVTNHLSDLEPLKSKVRSLSQIVLEEFITLSDLSTRTIFDRLGHIRSLMKIAGVAGMISKQNVALIDSEIIAIQSAIKDLQTEATNLSVNLGKVLMLDFVGESFVENTESILASTRTHAAIASRPAQTFQGLHPMNPVLTGAPTQVKNTTVHTQVRTPETGQNKQNIYQASQAPRPTAPKPEPKVNEGGESAQVSPPKKKEISTGVTERQSTIIKEIRNKGQLTIRDLVGKIEGVSEKTIQRELLALVESGVLKKEGERRWSRYSVN